jgi:hypothetical protein
LPNQLVTAGHAHYLDDLTRTPGESGAILSPASAN